MTVTSQVRTVNEEKLNAFLGKVVGDFGAALSSMLVYIGQKLGLYAAMAEAGPVSPEELARRTGLTERYLREWLLNQAAGGYGAHLGGRLVYEFGVGGHFGKPPTTTTPSHDHSHHH